VTNPSIIPGVSLAMMVNPAAMSQLKVSAFPPFVTAGTAYSFTVTAQDPFGNTIPTYRGTVTFTSPTDGAAMLPADYTFTAGDAGQHSNFMATLNTLGLQSITATDTVNSGFTGTESNIKVQSIQPTATVTPPDIGILGQPLTFVPGEPLTFTFGASQPGLPPDAVFTFNVSWGDGNSQSFTGTSSTTMDHTYLATGTFKINATATYPSTNGNTSLTVSLSVPITAVAMQKDPYDTSLTALYVGGTSGDDNIAITPATVSGGVKVGMNSASLGSFFPTGHVIVYGLAGNDIIKTAAQTIGGVLTYVNVPAIFFGGDGNDTLNVSGSGNMVVSGKMAGNVLMGGAGTDSLIGGQGRDILIGGLGADTVRAGSGGDILIGDTTSYDNNAVALASVLDEWRRTDIDYLTRVGQINGSMSGGINAPYYLNAGTVQADGAVNNLYGGAGMDWYFKGIMDVLTNVSSGEVVTPI
jgi:Ca2+-binding RTX toxin-like protein